MKKIILILLSLTFCFSAISYSAINTAHPRIWLDDTVKTRLEGYRDSNTTEYADLKSWCDTWLYSNQGSYLGAGYQGTEWYRAALNYALLYQTTGLSTYGNEGVVYLQAMLNDLNTVGDGQGGDTVIQVDSGWTARTFGAGVGVSRDWLDGSPDLTTSIINLCGSRLNTWITWYNLNGFSNDNPYDNYYAGYFSMVFSAAIGLYDDTNYQSSWYTQSELMWTNTVIPMINGNLDGGDWIEGWNYGQWSVREYMQYCRALETGTTDDDHWLETDWYSDLITSTINMLYPNRDYVSDDGSWSGSYKGNPRIATLRFLASNSPLSETLKSYAQWYTESVTWLPIDDKEWELFLFTDNSIIPDIPAFTNLYHYMEPGHLVGRSATWSDTTATYIDIIGRTIPETSGMHTQGERNMGEFKLASRGEKLIVDDDTYQTDSLYSSVPLVAGSHTYAPYQEWWQGDVVLKYENSTHILYSQVQNIDSVYDRNSASLTYYDREVVFFRPDITIIFDNAQGATNTNTVTYRWWYGGSPSVSGQDITLTVNSAKLFHSFIGDALTIGTPTAGSEITTHYFIDSALSNSGSTTNNQVINVFETTDNTQSTKKTTNYITETGSKMIGVHVEDTVNYLAMFTTSVNGASPSGVIEYQYTPTATTYHNVSHLSGSYSIVSIGTTTKTITLDPSGSDYNTSAEGVLAFSVTSDNTVTQINNGVPSTSPVVNLQDDYSTSTTPSSFSGTTQAQVGTIATIVSNNGNVTIDSGVGTNDVAFTVSGVNLVSGVNVVEVTVTDSEGNVTVEQINITLTQTTTGGTITSSTFNSVRVY